MVRPSDTACLWFFFQAEDGIREWSVTGVQTCALPISQHMSEGDGLELDNGSYIRVRAAAEPVIEIAAETATDLLRIAWHIGNRHLPLQALEGRLRIRADHVMATMVEGLGGRITRLQAPFDPEIGAYAGAAQGHEHEH